MANKEHVDLIRRDVDAWNTWRAQHPKVKPDLADADLSSADLMLANLRGADLRKADLSGANLVGARLLGVDLVQAKLHGADLSTAEDLTPEQLEHTTGDMETKLPEGLPYPRRWAVRRGAAGA